MVSTADAHNCPIATIAIEMPIETIATATARDGFSCESMADPPGGH
jgi:hypothetical protein